MEKDNKKIPKKRWLARLGIIGVLFFLVKGLIWIGVALLAWFKLTN